MRKKAVLIISVLFVALQSCIVPQKPFVASGFEPITVKQRGDVELSASIRPFKFYKANATVAINDWIALRAGYSGFPSLDNFDASLIFFKNFDRVGFFTAATYNYQNNYIKRNYSFEMWGIGRDFQYKCAYNSPGGVFGISFFSKKGKTHQFIFKTSYNIVNNYNYYFSSNTASGKQSGYSVTDEETLNYKILNFFSFEPSYSLIVSRPNRKVDVRYQLGFNFCETVLYHHYTFNTRSYNGPDMQSATNFHPVSFPVNFSIGFILKYQAKKAIGD